MPNPAVTVLLRAMIGGARDEDAVRLDEDALLEVVRRDLRTTMRIEAEPEFVRVFRHPLGIPQYVVGHLGRLDRIEAHLLRHPGLFVAGNGYRGVAIGACVAEAGPLAHRILTPPA